MRVLGITLLWLMASVGLAWAQTTNTVAGSEETVTIPKAEYEAIKAKLADLETQLQDLKSRLEETPAVEQVTPESGAAEEPTVIGGSTAAGVPQTLLPDISIVGDIVGNFTSDRTKANRNDVVLRGAELVLQGYLYPQIRGDAVVCMGEEHNHEAVVEECFLSFLQIGNSNLSAILGKRRLDFGKVNKIHPHHRPYVTAPSASENFLGDEGLIAEGASLSYLFPGKYFLNLEVGAWRVRSHTHLPSDEPMVEIGPGFDDKLYSARLWGSRELSDSSELEVGVSGIHGTGLRRPSEETDIRDSISLLGLDATYKNWFSAYGRTTVQGEVYALRREGNTRVGYYGFTGYKWNKYWELGLRYDWSERPFPLDGRDSGVSFILTNHLTETTHLRLQLSHGSRAGVGSVNEAFLQAIWGIGPHSHPLE